MRLASGSKDGSLAIWSLNSDGHGGATGAVLTFESIARLNGVQTGGLSRLLALREASRPAYREIKVSY